MFRVVKASKKLKQLELTIYIKPDRTKSERAEFERLHKKMTKAKENYPMKTLDSLGSYLRNLFFPLTVKRLTVTRILNHYFKNIFYRVMFWNINGRMQFLQTDVIRSWLSSNFDICFITETHMTKGEAFNLESFLSFHNAYSKPTCDHPRGGVSCFIQKKFIKNTIDINIEIENFIIVTLKGNHTLFGVYITPSDYDESSFAQLGNIFTPVDSNYGVIGGGDLNSRVGGIAATPPLPQAKYRPNPDVGSNSHGKTLKKICKSFKCYVLNNLSLQDRGFDGKITYCKGDLCLSNIAGLQVINTFT